MSSIIYQPHPDHPGWMTWKWTTSGHFLDVLGELAVRREADGTGRVRWWPADNLSNVAGVLHGGALLGFVDLALFAGAYAAGSESAQSAVTVECSSQFLAAGRLNEPVDAVVEVLRETGRMLFVRGIVEQQGDKVLAFSAILRKVPQ